MIEENPALGSLGTLPSLLLASYWGPGTGLYRPLTLASLSLDAALFGRESAFGFHLTNAILYAACSAALPWAMLRLGAAPLAASLAGLLFAAHPIHTEAVAPGVGRSELGCLLFLLLALGAAPRDAAGGRSWPRAAGVGLCFGISVGFKETGLALVALLPLLPLLFGPPPPAPAARPPLQRLAALWRVWLLLGLALLAWLAARGAALGADAFGPREGAVGFLDNPLVARDGAGRIAGGLAVSLEYLRMALWPWPLSADYSYRALVPPRSLAAPAALLGLATWLAQLLALLWLAGRPSPARSPERGLLALGIALYAATLFPAANVVRPIGTIFGERLLFAPSAGLCAIAGAGLGALVRRGGAPGRLALALASAAVLAGSSLFLARLPDWRSELALARSIVAARPESAKGHEKLGSELFRAAQTLAGEERARQVAAAEAELRAAIAILPGYPGAWGNLSLVVLARGDHEAWAAAAERHYELAPRDRMAISQKAMALLYRGQGEEALRISEEGLAAFPGSPALERPRAEALVRLGRFEEALAPLRALRAVYPDDVEVWRLLVDALVGSGRVEEAKLEIDLLLSAPRTASPYSTTRGSAAADHLRRARLALRGGTVEPALRDLRRALELDPGLSEARRLLADAERQQLLGAPVE
jgi:Flp pilus assembly protein TadD